MAHPQEGQSQPHREFQDDLRSVSALTEIPQANRSDGTPVVRGRWMPMNFGSENEEETARSVQEWANTTEGSRSCWKATEERKAEGN